MWTLLTKKTSALLNDMIDGLIFDVYFELSDVAVPNNDVSVCWTKIPYFWYSYSCYLS